MPKPKGAMGSPFTGMGGQLAGGFNTVGTNNNNMPTEMMTPDELRALTAAISKVGTPLIVEANSIIMECAGLRVKIMKLA